MPNFLKYLCNYSVPCVLNSCVNQIHKVKLLGKKVESWAFRSHFNFWPWPYFIFPHSTYIHNSPPVYYLSICLWVLSVTPIAVNVIRQRHCLTCLALHANVSEFTEKVGDWLYHRAPPANSLFLLFWFLLMNSPKYSNRIHV